MIRIHIASLVIALISASAYAQPFITLRGMVTPSSDSTLQQELSFSVVFHTQAAPENTDEEFIRFRATDAQIILRPMPFLQSSEPQSESQVTTFQAGPPIELETVEPLIITMHFAFLEYFAPFDFWQLRMVSQLGQEFFFVNFTIDSGAFHPGMTSLPDSPTSYGSGESLLSTFVFDNRTSEEVINATSAEHADSNSGLIFYSAHLTQRSSIPDKPTSKPACFPDLNGDGVLNFQDISLYIWVFSLGC
ncbi:MAG: hypothetical protein P1U30_09600 [Phycisphaerales bacterium]|nr:hypothetical protein [Phycisphaerales bacterium]